METIWQDLTNGIGGGVELTRIIFRLTMALVAGAAIGYQREWEGKAAGLRTHALVSGGACLLVIASASSGMSPEGLSRVVQGIVTGIGFLGAGNILKLSQEHLVKGLTTAAGIWVTAAIGVAIGLGTVGLALIGTALAIVILAIVKPLEASLLKGHISESAVPMGDTDK